MNVREESRADTALTPERERLDRVHMRCASAVLELEALNHGPAGLSVPRILPALGKAGALTECLPRTLVIAECLTDVLSPFQAAAVATHSELALPSLRGSDRLRSRLRHELALAEQGMYLFGFPLSGTAAGVRVSRVAGGLLLEGVSPGYPVAEDTDCLLVPIPAPTGGLPHGGVPVAVVPAETSELRLVPSAQQAHTSDAHLSGVFVPEHSVTTVSESHLAAARLWLSAYELTASERVLERTLRHLRTRRSFGTALAGHQSIQFRLAEHALRADGVRALIETIAQGRSRYDATTSPVAAELLASRLLRDVTAVCLHLYGASGQVAGVPVQQLLVESRMLATARALEHRAARSIRRTEESADDQ